jgi:HK97 family phage portal protein
MLERVKGWFKVAPGQGISLISSWLANAKWFIEAKFLPLAQRAYAQNEVVYACLRLLSSGIAEPSIKAYTVDEKGTRAELDPMHPLSKLMRRPNELMTEYEFWELVTLHISIVGRSFWWKQRSNGDMQMALWPLRPDRVGYVYSNSDKEGERVLSGYSYADPGDGSIKFITRRDVLAFNLPNPAGESGGIVEGLGPVEVLARQIASDNEATKFIGALLANYAAPTTVLSIKATMKPGEAQAIKNHFRSEFGGANLGIPAVIDADTTISQIGFNPRQLELGAVRSVSESRISAALGVPAVLVGLQTGIDASTYNNVSGMRRFFAETTLSTLWRRFSDQYQHDIAEEFDENLECDFDLSDVTALAINRQEAIIPVKEGFAAGAVTRNEYREALGLEPLAPEIGDVLLIPSNMLEVPLALPEIDTVAVRAFNWPGYALVERKNGHQEEETKVHAGS